MSEVPMAEPEITFERRGAVGLITLNRPRALNALTHGMCLAMQAELDAWKTDDTIGCVVIRGSGERAFCAGGDIRALYESGRAKTPYALEFWHDEYVMNATIKHYPKPYLSLLRGVVMGGGVGVSVHGTFCAADESIVFAMPETGIGLFPDVGGSYILPRLPGQLGMFLALTGTRLKLADCVAAGIVSHVVPATAWSDLLDRLNEGIAMEDALGTVAAVPAPGPLAEHRARIDALFSGGSVEAIVAALDADGSDWAREQAQTIRTKSPTSLKITFQQLRRGAHLDFDDCMRMEFRIASRVYAGRDFYEGVRATIVDKDQKPVWQPAALRDVSDADVEAYFAPLGEKELKL
jgi:enoyl-CoA hydratase